MGKLKNILKKNLRWVATGAVLALIMGGAFLGYRAYVQADAEFLFSISMQTDFSTVSKTDARAKIEPQLGTLPDDFASRFNPSNYSWDAYVMGYGSTAVVSGGGTYSTEEGLDFNQYYHSFKIGLLPKFNIGVGRGAIALGIGGGVKIPISGWFSMTSTSAVQNSTIREGLVTDNSMELKRQDITDMFSPAVIGYMKVTFDYYLFFTDNIGMNFGLYLGGDFAPKQKETKIGCNSFDIGLQLGFRFGPKA